MSYHQDVVCGHGQWMYKCMDCASGQIDLLLIGREASEVGFPSQRGHPQHQINYQEGRSTAGHYGFTQQGQSIDPYHSNDMVSPPRHVAPPGACGSRHNLDVPYEVPYQSRSQRGNGQIHSSMNHYSDTRDRNASYTPAPSASAFNSHSPYPDASGSQHETRTACGQKTCPYCGENFKKSGDCDRHIKCLHEKHIWSIHPCPNWECPHSKGGVKGPFTRRDYLQKHWQTCKFRDGTNSVIMPASLQRQSDRSRDC